MTQLPTIKAQVDFNSELNRRIAEAREANFWQDLSRSFREFLETPPTKKEEFITESLT